MVLRRRPIRRRNRRNFANNGRRLQRVVSNLRSGVPVRRKRVPNDPPPITYGIRFMKVIEMMVLVDASKDADVVYNGSTAEPGSYIYGKNVTYYNLGFDGQKFQQIIGAQCGIPADSSLLWSVRNVTVWGPNSNYGSGYDSIEVGVVGKEGALIAQRDSGTRNRRSCVSVSMTDEEWYTAQTTYIPFTIAFGTQATGYVLPKLETSAIGVVRVTVEVKVGSNRKTFETPQYYFAQRNDTKDSLVSGVVDKALSDLIPSNFNRVPSLQDLANWGVKVVIPKSKGETEILAKRLENKC